MAGNRAAAALAAATGLLPGSKEDFSSPAFWRTFFERRGDKAFEWYGTFAEFRGNVERAWAERWSRGACRTLVIGCGNSELSEQLYAAGWTTQTSIDFDAGVIADMRRKYSPGRFPGLVFTEMDARALSFDAASFDLVVDKGTLDAICTGDGADVRDNVARMLGEVSRVIAPGGLYAVVSLAQRHVLRELLGLAHTVAAGGGGGSAWASLRLEAFDAPDHSSPLCPFVFLAEAAAPAGGSSSSSSPPTCPFALRMPALLPAGGDAAAPPASSSAGARRSESDEREELAFALPRAPAGEATVGSGGGGEEEEGGGVFEAVVRAQITYRTAQQLGAIAPGHFVELDVWAMPPARAGNGGGFFITPAGVPPPAELARAALSSGGGAGDAPARPRFSITVVDASATPRAGVLLVPQGREHEWSFGAREGQAQLCGESGFGRLLFVAMGRGHAFPGGQAAVQAELSAVVRRLVPAALLLVPARAGGGVPFLAVAEDIGARTIVAEGVSALSGAWVVEDVPWADDMDAEADDEGAGEAAAPPLSAAAAAAAAAPAAASKARRKRDKKKQAKARSAAATASAPSAVRRLVFLSNRNAIQSAVRLLGPSATPDPGWLDFSYHRGMVAAVAMHLNVSRLRVVGSGNGRGRAHVVVIGLGGGALPTFLATQLPEVRAQRRSRRVLHWPAIIHPLACRST